MSAVGATGRAVTWPRGLVGIGFLLVLASAWAGIVCFVGPTFGYGADGTGSWDWTYAHALLHAVPGAVGVFCGLVVMAHAGGRRAVARVSLSFWGLATLAVGAWMVVGYAAWPVFEHGVVFAPSATAFDRFIRLVGYNIGIGGVILVLAGMILKAATGERAVVPVLDRSVATEAPVQSAPADSGPVTATYPTTEA